MAAFFVFLESNQILIYGLFGIVFIIYFQRFLFALREWRRALYGLEKEAAMRGITTSLVVMMVVGIILVLEFSVVTYIAPSYQDVLAFASPTVELSEEQQTEEADKTPEPGGIETPIVVTLNPLVSGGCVEGELEWFSPVAGSEIRGSVELIVTVNFENLAFYKYEYSQAGSDTWTPIAASDSGGIEKSIGFWNPSTLVPGDYRLRLVVINRDNQTLPVCEIPVTVLAEG
jgi:hypothetical protein